MRYQTVSTSAEVRSKLLVALLNVPHDLYELSAIVEEPTFVVGGELREMKRDRLVGLVYTDQARVWHITARGLELATRANQERMFA